MGDGNGGPPLRQPGEGLLDLLFRLQVHVRGGLVEDEDGRIVQNGAGDTDALLLAAGEIAASLAHLRVIAVRPG